VLLAGGALVVTVPSLLAAATCVLVLSAASVLSKILRRGTRRRPRAGKTLDKVLVVAGVLGALTSLAFWLWLAGVLPR
jgi:hypothetical protein